MTVTDLLTKLRDLRERKGWTQQDLADRTSLGYDTISRLENGDRRLRVDQYLDIAHGLGIQPGDLLPSTRGTLPLDVLGVIDVLMAMPPEFRATGIRLLNTLADLSKRCPVPQD